METLMSAGNTPVDKLIYSCKRLHTGTTVNIYKSHDRVKCTLKQSHQLSPSCCLDSRAGA